MANRPSRPRATFRLRAEWWHLGWLCAVAAGFAVFMGAMTKVAFPDFLPTCVFGAASMASAVSAVRIVRSGIYVYDESVVVRGVLVTRSLARRAVKAVGVRGDSPYGLSRRPVCVGVVRADGVVIAPETLAGSRGDARVGYLLYQLSNALGVPAQPNEG